MIIKQLKSINATQLMLRYLAEVVIIFLGITFSFLFEQWRKEREEKKELVELSKSLLTDIEALKKKLSGDLYGSSIWINNLDSLRIQRNSNNISERQLNWFHQAVTGQVFFLFDAYSPTYMSALGNGSVNELPEHIRSQLYDIYRMKLPLFQLLYNQQQENITNFRNSIMTLTDTDLYTNQASQINPDLKVLANEVRRPIYGNFITQVIATEKEVYKMNEEASRNVTILEKSLKTYVKENGEL